MKVFAFSDLGDGQDQICVADVYIVNILEWDCNYVVVDVFVDKCV